MTMGGGANAPDYDTSPFAPAYLYGLPSGDTLRIDDLLDLPNHDLFAMTAADVHQYHLPVKPDDVSTTPVIRSQSVRFYPHLSSSSTDDIYVPNEEAAELEWLSKYVEDSFSDAPYPPSPIPNHPYSKAQDHATSNAASRGARSKRSRAHTAANWHSQQTSSSTSSSDLGNSRPKRNVRGAENGAGVGESGVRRCAHCASEKTPQWRGGPLGPKTLCNACGVRYKSGRLVPEYRPAASPSFVLTQHSNSHRKVVELRRQKEAHQPNTPRLD